MVYARSGSRGPNPDVIEGFTLNPVTGELGNSASPSITGVSFATGTLFQNPLAISNDGTRLFASERADIPTAEVPTPRVTIFDAAPGAAATSETPWTSWMRRPARTYSASL